MVAQPKLQPAKRYLFTVDEYEKMIKAGVFDEDLRLELIEGELIKMVPISSDHSGRVKRLLRLVMTRLGERAVIGVQDPVRLGERSEPQPDISVLKPSKDFYTSSHPSAADVFLIIEVAVASLRFDRNTKVSVYARNRIRELWIVDVPNERIECFRQPSAGSYKRRSIHKRGETIAPQAFPDVKIAVDEVLG